MTKIDMNVGGNYLRLMFIVTSIERIKANIEGMKAENEQRKVTGDSMAYTEESFYKLGYQLDVYANELAQMHHDQDLKEK